MRETKVEELKHWEASVLKHDKYDQKRKIHYIDFCHHIFMQIIYVTVDTKRSHFLSGNDRKVVCTTKRMYDR